MLGFAITKFSDYYKAHATEDGEFEVSIPKWVPANLEEEMDFDADSIKLGRPDRGVLLGPHRRRAPDHDRVGALALRGPSGRPWPSG